MSCWQSTSSGFFGIRSGSTRPAFAARAVTTAPGQFGGGRGEDHASGLDPDAVPGPADSLQASRGTARQADQDREVGLADVDAQFQARAGDDRLQLARLESGLDRPPAVGIERRVVGGDGLGADAHLVAEVVRDLLGQGPGVGEDDGRPGPLGSPRGASGAAGDRSGPDGRPRPA